MPILYDDAWCYYLTLTVGGNMDFPIPNETATEQSKRLKTVTRQSLVGTLESTLKRVKQRERTLPIRFTAQCIPLSTNKMSGRRKTYETKEYLEYRDVIARVAGGSYGISKKDLFNLEVEVAYSNKRADADNCLKPLLDSITACVDDDFDDSQVYDIHVRKRLVKKGQEHLNVLLTSLPIDEYKKWEWGLI